MGRKFDRVLSFLAREPVTWEGLTSTPDATEVLPTQVSDADSYSIPIGEEVADEENPPPEIIQDDRSESMLCDFLYCRGQDIGVYVHETETLLVSNYIKSSSLSLSEFNTSAPKSTDISLPHYRPRRQLP